MKQRILVVCIAAVVAIAGSAQAVRWMHVETGIETNLIKVTDAVTVSMWMIDDAGSIYHSNDAGRTWTTQITLPGNSFTSIDFADHLFGTVISEEGRILRTLDGGSTWQLMVEELDESYSDVYCVTDSLKAYVVGAGPDNYPVLRYTEDGWTTSQVLSFPVVYGAQNWEGYALDIEVPEFEKLVVTTRTYDNVDVIQMSTDNGANWIPTMVGGTGFNDIDFYEPMNGLAAEQDGSVWYSFTGGGGWSYIFNMDGPANAVASCYNDFGWAVGDNGRIARTEDAGLSWVYEDSGTLSDLNHVDVYNFTHGIAVGDNGTVVVFDERPDIATLALTPVNAVVPSGGGSIVYDASLVSTFQGTIPNLTFWTTALDVNNNVYGPLTSQTFTHTPFMNVTVTGLTLAVPANAPAGLYYLRGYVGSYPEVMFYDRFIVEKEAAAGTEYTAPSSGDWTASVSFPGAKPVDRANRLPELYVLSEAYPNPFNPSTSLRVSLPKASELTVQVFDITGRRVATLADGSFTAGEHMITFDGSSLSSGIYFVRADVPGQLNQVRKITLMK